MRKSLHKIQIKKAAGPDNLSGKLIKSCMNSLFYIIHRLFEISLATCTYPTAWKIGEIVPVEKKPLPQCDNDLRPVTLTSILSKCLERVGLYLLMPYVEHLMDPMQFAYVKARSTSDAVVTVMHKIAQHLDRNSSNTARVLCIDFSSAFNTIQPHLMIKKLNQMSVPPPMQSWIFDYLTGRPQFVRTSHETSNVTTLNTGAPQGCVLSPVLFVLYTNDLKWQSDNVFITKYADDTIVAGLLKDDDSNEYLNCIDYVCNWCAENYLDLNVSKTKELVWDYRRSRARPAAPVRIGNINVDKTDNYKYLGITVDTNFKFNLHVEVQCKKAAKRMYFVRSLVKLHVKSELIVSFFNTIVLPVLMYASVAFFGLLSQQLKHELSRSARICERLLHHSCVINVNENYYAKNVLELAKKIIDDDTHPLHDLYELLPSGRRYRMPRIRTQRYKDTFLPVSIGFLNGKL